MIDFIYFLVFLFVLIFYALAMMLRRFTYYSLSVEAHLIGYILVFFVFPMFFGYVYVPKEILEYGDVEAYFEPVLMYSFLMVIILMCISYYDLCFIKPRPSLAVSYDPDEKLNMFILLLFLLYYIFLTFFILFKTDYRLIFTNFDVFAMQIRNGGAFYLNILYTIEFLPFLYFVRSSRLSYSWIFLYLSAAIFIFLLLGARTLVVSSVLGLIVVLSVRKSFDIGKLIVPAFFLIFAFILSSVVRTGMEVDFDKLTGYFSRNSDQLANTSVVYKEVKEERLEIQRGGTLIDAYYYLIPSSIVDDKPKSYYPSRLIYGEVAERTGRTFNFGLFGRSILDFGFYLSFLIVLLVLVFYKRVYKYLQTGSNSFLYLFCLWIYSHLFQVFILGVNSHFISVALFNFIASALLFKFCTYFLKLRLM